MDNTININTNPTSSMKEEYKPVETYPTSDTGDYPEVEAALVDDSKKFQPKDIMQKIVGSKFRRLLIPIGLIVAIFILYQILGLFSQKKRAEEEIVIPSSSQSAAKLTATSQLAPSPAQEVEEKVIAELKTVSQQEKQDVDVTSRIEGMIRAQQSALVSLNNNLNKSLGDLSLSVNNLATNVNTLVMASKKAAKPKKKKITRVVRRNVYHVKAIVPGRAWLEDSKGSTITVRIGDMINNGKVEMISPAQGIVVTSSGEVIQYGDNDI